MVMQRDYLELLLSYSKDVTAYQDDGEHYFDWNKNKEHQDEDEYVELEKKEQPLSFSSLGISWRDFM